MARRPCTFKQQDLTRALRGAIAAGITIQRVEIEAAKFTIFASAIESPQSFEAELDQELAVIEAKICGST